MQNQIKTKKVLKWIKEQAKQLEPETYIAYPKTFGVPPHLKDKKGLLPYWYVVPTEYPVNHARRIYSLYKKFGLEGTNFYFIQRGLTLNSVNPTLEL